MKTEGHIDIPMSDITHKMTLNVRVTGLRTWQVRQRVGIWLIRLATYVMGIGLHVELERDEFERRDRRQSEPK